MGNPIPFDVFASGGKTRPQPITIDVDCKLEDHWYAQEGDWMELVEPATGDLQKKMLDDEEEKVLQDEAMRSPTLSPSQWSFEDEQEIEGEFAEGENEDLTKQEQMDGSLERLLAISSLTRSE